VLDGGLAGWTGPTASGEEQTQPGYFVVHPGGLPMIDATGAAAVAESGTLIDVRTAVRYRGEAEPIDPVAGHIPGAVNIPVTEHTRHGLLDAATPLRKTFEEAGVRPGRPVAAYCGSGVAAAQTVLALHRAGRTDAALYVGSWSDWITDPGRPIATGDRP
jgi:thiosulfate/3-mercaptopyruvate sulfurtransferase